LLGKYQCLAYWFKIVHRILRKEKQKKSQVKTWLLTIHELVLIVSGNFKGK